MVIPQVSGRLTWWIFFYQMINDLHCTAWCNTQPTNLFISWGNTKINYSFLLQSFQHFWDEGGIIMTYETMDFDSEKRCVDGWGDHEHINFLFFYCSWSDDSRGRHSPKYGSGKPFCIFLKFTDIHINQKSTILTYFNDVLFNCDVLRFHKDVAIFTKLILLKVNGSFELSQVQKAGNLKFYFVYIQASGTIPWFFTVFSK